MKEEMHVFLEKLLNWAVKSKRDSNLKDKLLCLFRVDHLTPPPILLHDIPD